MSLKNNKKPLPARVAVGIGIIFVLLFFLTATLTVTQIRVKNLQQKKAQAKKVANRDLQLKLAAKEEQKRQAERQKEEKGMLIFTSGQDIFVETSKTATANQDSKIINYKVTDNTMVILTSMVEGKENEQLGSLEDLTEGNFVSVREEDKTGIGESAKSAKIVRVFKFLK